MGEGAPAGEAGGVGGPVPREGRPPRVRSREGAPAAAPRVEKGSPAERRDDGVDDGPPEGGFRVEGVAVDSAGDGDEPGAWDVRSLTGVLGVNVVFGPLLLRLHFGHPFDVGGQPSEAQKAGTRWVTNFTLRWFFF